MLLVLNKAVVHFVGDYDAERVEILVTKRERRRDPALERRIEETWTERQRANGSGPEDTVLARLVAHGVLPERLVLYLGRTTYKEYLGTNLEARDLHEALGEDCFANPLGVRTAVMTRDGAVLLGRRPIDAPEYGGMWGLPGDCLFFEPERGGDPFATALDVARRRLGLGPDDIERLSCVGLVEDGQTHLSNLVLRCQVPERARALLKRVRSAGDPTHDEYMCIPTNKNDLIELMRNRGDELTPAAAGGLAIFVS